MVTKNINLGQIGDFAEDKTEKIAAPIIPKIIFWYLDTHFSVFDAVSSNFSKTSAVLLSSTKLSSLDDVIDFL